MGVRKTHEEFVRDFKVKNTHAEQIEFLSEYQTARKKILCRCKKCNYEWESTPDRLLSKNGGCPKCNGYVMMTPYEFDEKIKEVNKHYNEITFGHFVSLNKRIDCTCNVCGHQWSPIAKNLINGTGCSVCAGNSLKTNEQFIIEFKENNPNYEKIKLLSSYVNRKIKIKCECLICNHQWETDPHNLVIGTGCPKCANILKYTHEEFVNRVKDSNIHFDDMEFLSGYNGNTNKIKCRCKVCGKEWETKAGIILGGKGCPYCGKTRRKTNDEFLELFYKNNEQANTIEILDTYILSSVKLKCRCKKCGHEWKALPNSLLQNHGCAKCAGITIKTQDEFVNEVSQKLPQVEVIDNYVNEHTSIKYRCKIHKVEWCASPNRLLHSVGCPQCVSERRKEFNLKTNEEFVEELFKINPLIKPLTEYTLSREKVKCLCLKCNKEFSAKANSLLSNHGCPNCASSRGETRINSFLTLNKIEFEPQKRFSDLKGTGNGLLSYDFYIPFINCLIEYQGEQHYNPVKDFGSDEQFKIQIEHDKRKREYALSNGYDFLEIPYWDYNNIETILSRKLNIE